ncbi:MAG: hypothetical protein IGBAC_0595 [Ignavibacteriae bacterium]|nr:MAG: hypothetical protein IGBAC_0595 [Ignavibacteriota bacterium]
MVNGRTKNLIEALPDVSLRSGVNYRCFANAQHGRKNEADSFHFLMKRIGLIKIHKSQIENYFISNIFLDEMKLPV